MTFTPQIIVWPDEWNMMERGTGGRVRVKQRQIEGTIGKKRTIKWQQLNDQVMWMYGHERSRMRLSGMQLMMTESMEMCWTDKTLWEEMQEVMKSERQIKRQSCWLMNKIIKKKGGEESGQNDKREESVCLHGYLSDEDTGDAFRIVSFRVWWSKQLLTFPLLEAV